MFVWCFGIQSWRLGVVACGLGLGVGRLVLCSGVWVGFWFGWVVVFWVVCRAWWLGLGVDRQIRFGVGFWICLGLCWAGSVFRAFC